MTENDATIETHSGGETAAALVAFICAAGAGLILPTQGVMSTIGLVLLFLSGWALLQLDMPIPAVYILFFILAFLTRILPCYSLGLMLLLPLFVFITVCAIFEPLRSGTLWLRWGRVTTRGIAVGGAVVALSCVSLVVWYRLCHPDISAFTASLPHASGIVLPAVGVAFSVTNALAEECIYRGILWEGLSAITRRWPAVLVVQALIFGVAHWWGVPNGVIGVILGIIYGLMMGIVRRVSGGLLLPVIVHIFADLVVFTLLLDTAGRLG
jgi:hypothetical protein